MFYKFLGSVIKSDNNELTAALNSLGEHKPTIWSFEQGWRFKLIILPFSIKEIDPTNPLLAHRALEEEKELSIEEYFLEVSDEVYSQMEVRLGPACTESDELIVEALVQKYNPAALFFSSNLKGRVR